MGNTLNEYLDRGANLIELIPHLLLMFRIDKIRVTADIDNAFPRISISPKDMDYLRYLLWNDIFKDEIKTYRYCRVFIGVKPSPFFVIRYGCISLILFTSNQ